MARHASAGHAAHSGEFAKNPTRKDFVPSEIEVIRALAAHPRC
ncbi:hypothetical protein [uncultured Bradyrhizobium sp.]|nr:hypothetical protein [uncultured Bradyrhizobium sp.]